MIFTYPETLQCFYELFICGIIKLQTNAVAIKQFENERIKKF